MLLQTPEWDRDHQNRIPNVYFHLKFIVPELEDLDAKPVVINNFETDIPNGRHQFADLVDKILFKSASVKGTNGGIRVEVLSVLLVFAYPWLLMNQLLVRFCYSRCFHDFQWRYRRNV